jgi:hypothetical protein
VQSKKEIESPSQRAFYLNFLPVGAIQYSRTMMPTALFDTACRDA